MHKFISHWPGRVNIDRLLSLTTRIYSLKNGEIIEEEWIDSSVIAHREYVSFKNLQ